MRLRVCFPCFLMLSFVAAFSQTDVEGSKDHPLFTRMSNFHITSFEEREYDLAKFVVPQKDAFKRMEMEGKKTVITYMNNEGLKPAPSRLQITRNYLNAAKKIGGTVVFDGKGNDWSSVEDGGLYAMQDLTVKFSKAGGRSGHR